MARNYTKQIPPYGLRLQPDLKGRIEASAAKNGTSLHAEIIKALEERFPPEDQTLELLNRYHSLAEHILKGDYHPSQQRHLKEEMDQLYKELLRRRDRDYPEGPLDRDGKPLSRSDNS